MLKIEFRLLTRSAFEQLLHRRPVFRVNALQNEIDGSVGRRLVTEDPIRFSRPVDLSAGNLPAETAGVAEFLSFGEIGFSTLQLAIEFLERNNHVVEHIPEAGDLIPSGSGNPMTEITSRQCRGAFDQSAEWLSDAAGYGRAKQGGEQESHHGCRRQNPKNAPLNRLNIQDGLGAFLADLAINILYELGTPGL